MANFKEVRKKIDSVKSIQKITRAMKLVSTAKLVRSEQLAKNSIYYADKINELTSHIMQNLIKNKKGFDSRLLENIVDVKVVDIVIITSDKGLCGGFNYQVIKAVNKVRDKYINQGVEIRLRVIGEKGIGYFEFQKIEMLCTYKGISSMPTYNKAKDIITKAAKDFIDKKTDKVVLIYNSHKSMISQEIKIGDILPVDTSKIKDAPFNYIEIEPDDIKEVVGGLLYKYIEYNMYYALIDSLAAEHSARVQAMDNATNNAKDKVEKLSIEYHKARQASITTELNEIVSGMESIN